MYKKLPVRKTSPRLKDYDYSLPGMYFVTINTHGNAPILGRIIRGEMKLSEAGIIAHSFWSDLPNHSHGLKLDTFIIMPNHLHGILFLTNESANRKSLSEIIRGYKTWSARRINESRNTKGTQIWQRSFYDHVIRNE